MNMEKQSKTNKIFISQYILHGVLARKKQVLLTSCYCMLALSVISCINSLEDLGSLDEDVILKDSTDTDDEGGGGNTGTILGLFHSESELKAWRSRANNGPFKSKGDFVKNSPEEWQRIVDFKNKFMANPANDLIKNPNAVFYDKHHYLLAAAFFALVKENANVATEVKKQLLAQKNQLKYSDFKFDKHNGFHEANWMTRLLFSYDYIKQVLSADERKQMQNWFKDLALYLKNNAHNNLRNYFPKRLAGDYSVRAGAAESGGFDKGLFAFIDKSGNKKNQIYWYNLEYNNRMASKVKFATLVGIMLNNQELIKHGKVFCREMIMFGTFPDGTLAEYERNGDYGAPQTGAMYYGAINIETVINIAEALRRTGDNSIYTYKTSNGLWSTSGGPKDLRLMIEAYMENMTSRVERYHNSVKKSNLIDFNDELNDNRFIVFDIVFSLANKHYKDPSLKSEYLRKSGSMPPYKGGGYWHAVSAWWAFSGPTATFPSYAFMFAGLEDN